MKLGIGGFTLIELLVIAAVGMVAGALLIQLLAQNNGFFYQQRSKVTEGLGLNATSQEIAQDLRLSSAVVAGYPIGSPTILSSANTLVLQIPSIDSTGMVIANTYDYFIYQTDASNAKVLRRTIYPDPSSSRKSQSQVLVTDLSSLQFTYLNDNGVVVAPSSSTQVKYILDVSINVGQSTEQDNVSGQIHLRNQ